MRTGHTFTPEKTVQGEAHIRNCAIDVIGTSFVPVAVPLSVTVLAVFPIAPSWPKKKQADARSGVLRHTKKPDLDNIVKMLDALNGIVWVDDSQIDQVFVRKVFGDQPRTVISIRDDKPW